MGSTWMRGGRTDSAPKRVAALRYNVTKDGVVLGGHDLYEPARKHAAKCGGEVVDTRPPTKPRSK